ncbi:MAG TPA: hypothetical protein VGM42_16130 [Rhodopila sp.]
MHRSGTSAVAGTAVRLGFSPPLTPLPLSPDNPSGFYESIPVTQLNHQLLSAVGCSWDQCLTVEPDRFAAMLQPGDWRQFSDTVRDQFASTAGFVLKDPRLCLTLPVWLPALQAVEATVSVLLVVRHPEEVVRSLARRNQLPEAQMIPNWLHHMLEAERLSRGLNRAVIFYDDLLTDWRRCMTRAGQIAHIAWPRPILPMERDVDDFLAPSARHHVAPQTTAAIGPPPVCDMVNAAWTALRHLSNDPGSAGALRYLDQVREAFAAWRRQTHPPGAANAA